MHLVHQTHCKKLYSVGSVGDDEIITEKSDTKPTYRLKSCHPSSALGSPGSTITSGIYNLQFTHLAERLTMTDDTTMTQQVLF